MAYICAREIIISDIEVQDIEILSKDGPGFVSISPESKRIKNIKKLSKNIFPRHNICLHNESQGFNIMPLQTQQTRGHRVLYLPFTHTFTLLGTHSKIEEEGGG